MILTLAQPQDAHAYAVHEALRQKGSDARLWITTDLAQLQQASLRIDRESDASLAVEGGGLVLDSEPITTIWHRHPELPTVTDALHPSDRRFAEREYEEFFLWLVGALPADVFWVNPRLDARRAESKIEQQRVAERAGLTIPRTLYSNDPARIRAFLEDVGGHMVYKNFRMQWPWLLGKDGKDGFAVTYAAALSAEKMPEDEVLQATPGIYQELLAKDYELRITVIGRRVFPAAIDSQSTEDGRLDWRRAHAEVPIRDVEIPAELERAILAVMDDLGLVFGAFDFVKTPAGEYVFLEVNEMGQFLFVENVTGVPMLDAFCEMLIQGRPDFRWDPADATVSYPELEPTVRAILDREGPQHIQQRPPLVGLEDSGA